MTIQSYRDFLASKRVADPSTGMETVPALPDFLFPHQRDIVRWALRRGRAAIFAGTGLGKTLMELVWSREVARFTGRPVLLLGGGVHDRGARRPAGRSDGRDHDHQLPEARPFRPVRLRWHRARRKLDPEEP